LVVIDTYRGRASLTSKPDFQGLAQYETFGQTSVGFAKQPYNVEINDGLGNDLAAPLLGLPAEADWKLRNPFSDKCLMNDFLGYELFEQMGRYSCRRRFVEVFRDVGGGKLTYPGDYHGILVLFEKIEVGKHRVDIAELTPSQTNEPAISGGYIFKKDKDSVGDVNFNTTGHNGFSGEGLKLHEPKPRDVNNNANHPQVVWLRNYLNRFETNLYSSDWLTRTGTNHYSYHIDVDSFVDQHWIVEFTKQIDGYRLSDFFSKDSQWQDQTRTDLGLEPELRQRQLPGRREQQRMVLHLAQPGGSYLAAKADHGQHRRFGGGRSGLQSEKLSTAGAICARM